MLTNIPMNTINPLCHPTMKIPMMIGIHNAKPIIVTDILIISICKVQLSETNGSRIKIICSAIPIGVASIPVLTKIPANIPSINAAVARYE